MAVLPIKIYGERVLRQQSEPVDEVTPELEQLAHDMLETMYEAPGIGLAAPQIGKSIQLLVADVGEEDDRDPHILFNPEIIHAEGENVYEEGCLSFPGIYVNITRPEIISVKALDEKGNAILLDKIDGLLARCIQHEMDHLQGVLLVDKISPADKLLLEGKLKKLKQNKSR